MTRYAPLWEQANSYPASVDRRLIGAAFGVSAVGAPYPMVTGCAVTVAAGTMNMNVAAGSVSVPTPNNTGSVLCYSDAVEVVASPTAPASGSNRIDVVVCQARGNDLDGGANNDFLFQVVAGTAATAGSEVAPATPAGAVALAQIRVIGGAASLNSANLVDRRILQPWDRPWGMVGFATTTTPHNGIGAVLTNVNGLTVTFATVANRRIKLTTALVMQQNTGAGVTGVFIVNANGNVSKGGGGASMNPGTFLYTSTLAYDTPPAGSNTYNTQANTNANTMNCTCNAQQPMYLWAEDVGPASAPAL